MNEAPEREEARRAGRSGGKKFARAVSYALDGISATLASERNMKIHFTVASLLFLFELITRPQLAAVALSVAVATAVMAAEMVNTAVEQMVDTMANGQVLAFAKLAKDATAGAVLLLAFGSLGVGFYIVVDTYPWHWRTFSSLHGQGAVLSACALGVLGTLAVHSYRWARRAETSGRQG